MGQALYRKHRPKKLKEVIGQEHITDTLASALKNGRISHAYLFTGPKGVGKTSVARILAREVNGLAYTEGETNLDIIEIDAASNRRIDEIRELRERVHNAPTSAKYKVYIIDEVHMLTREAFNALLKTLEEPPEHAIFILATTEAHKLPDTIVSRTQRFNFKPIDNQIAATHLRNLAETEDIEVSDEALELIAEHGGGSFRDSISLLDQARNSAVKLDSKEVRRMLGIAPSQAVEQLLTARQSGDVAQVIELLHSLHEQGSSARQLAKQLADELRQQFVSDTTTRSDAAVIKLMRELIEVPASHEPFAALQIAFIDASMPQYDSKLAASKPIDNSTPAISPVQQTSNEPVKISSSATPPLQMESLKSTELWPRVLSEIKRYHTTLYSLARMAKTTTKPGHLELEFDFAFHQKRLSESKNKQIISDILRKLTGEDYEVVCVVADASAPVQKTPKTKTAQPASPIAAISNIFGDAEVLES